MYLDFTLKPGAHLQQIIPKSWNAFVMNTQEEIDQTIDDFENYTNGFEKARHWRSESAISLDY